MMDVIKKLFTRDANHGSSVNDQDRTNSIHLATAAILLELANIDGEFSEIERDNIISVFKSGYNLTEEDIARLIEESGKELGESTGLWQFTNLINQNYSLEQKIGIMETVWRVAYADGKMDANEDYLAHKVATLLRLNHKQLIDAKLKVLHGDAPQNS